LGATAGLTPRLHKEYVPDLKVRASPEPHQSTSNRFAVCTLTNAISADVFESSAVARMNPEDPESAHSIVTEYVRVLEHDSTATLPASVRTLPFPKQTIKAAILTCAASLREAQQLSAEMHQFLEQAYVALADYVDDDMVRAMTEYREALTSIADVRAARDRLQSPAWQRVAETSRLAGEIARSIADDTTALRLEFLASADGAPA
jgi:hypothetical protein